MTLLMFLFCFYSFSLTPHWPQAQRQPRHSLKCWDDRPPRSGFLISLLFIYVEALGAEAGQEFYGWPRSQYTYHCINKFFLFTVKLFILTMLEPFLRNASSDIVLPFFNTQTSKQKLLNAGDR